MRVILTAMGGGWEDSLTMECRKALAQADLIIGAKRLLDALPEELSAKKKAAVKAEEILAALEEGEAVCCILFSGDTGFYSGTRLLLPQLAERGIPAEVLPGVSSVQILAARLGRPWQEWKLVSAHGLSCDPVTAVMEGKPVFFLTDGKNSPADLCRKLTEAGLGELEVMTGENLAGPEERIGKCSAAEAAEKVFSPLSVMLAEAAPQGEYTGPGIPDDVFLRGKVPMTKREVRAAILAKLAVRPEDVVWDVGAGTGSVSVELALAAKKGRVYAVEMAEEACELVRANREKFCAWNLALCRGKAPEALRELPVPQAVFVGGTKGEMGEILSLALEKNPDVRICVSAITLENLWAAVEGLRKQGLEPVVTQISVSKTKAIGELHLLMANNPVFLITGGCHD
ncbi:precorrin-6y C5,15-methyltransferase (decarboxylating) subunit CbiE [Anaerotignum lactatifermentans]|uniref:Precorrin-6y C5,15-methyltransferase (Decarboxylating) subunit CbiE n=1 Tax=Anaerotignum lactatifermentans TaxID=160404 RepID=A0ABS2GAR3_9FIRM|nr:precorrin-6y C5,15-methyltransferase (decarboxylating) subunit CbiE [Anaerotignum lactatifermentans]MBM6829803.1 precorrin-6y C5,15-methyltransferase (decarboxylating) subunit CbiE [Anaerotignum lactatifermentans]MBM6878257.1 precorrin-6y C5,15-methyltransferase (decarboxylating) subunit CbiE [Anaerotignum lactatifermentans]MBM6951337.1 precorrin-6y C5,15-methyltransferase (decarboxylating) subunit CbiE [Anaerotignum lactatifermentans]